MRPQTRAERLIGGLGDAQRLGDHHRHQGRIADRRQLDEIDAIFELVEHINRNLKAQARFAHAARAGQRQQAHRGAAQEIAYRH